MKNKLKKVSNEKEQLVEYIKQNPGVKLDELSDIWNGLDGYDFMQAMIALFDEYKVIEDSGYYFPDEATRQKTKY